MERQRPPPPWWCGLLPCFAPCRTPEAPACPVARLLRLGLVSNIVGQVLFAFAVLFLFELLRPINRRQATSMLLLAQVGIPMACLNEVSLLAAAQTLAPKGLWLIPLAILVSRSGFIPRLIALLLCVAAVAYLPDWTLGLIQPELALPFQHLFTFELSLPLWLTVRGINLQRWSARMEALQGAA